MSWSNDERDEASSSGSSRGRKQQPYLEGPCTLVWWGRGQLLVRMTCHQLLLDLTAYYPLSSDRPTNGSVGASGPARHGRLPEEAE